MLDKTHKDLEPKANHLATGSLIWVGFFLSTLGADGAHAQTNAPLFASDDAIEITLRAPIRVLVNRRARRPDVAGLISYEAQTGETIELDVEVTPRGVSRLELCRFPPLRLNLKRGQVAGTVFAGQNRIKLGTRCMDNDRYEQYMLLEYLAYRIYEQVTELSFKVRLATLRYVDIDRDDRVEVAPAFFIEHIDGLAERAGMRAIEQEGGFKPVDMAPEPLALYGLFQYMIGNTDWSAIRATEGRECCHNTDILGPREGTTGLIPVPYDFDQVGLVNTPYAEPGEGLRIRSVTDRLYRGLCSGNDYIETAIERFNAARSSIEALFETDRLQDEYRSDALDFLDGFYEIVNDPAQLQSEIFERCRG